KESLDDLRSRIETFLETLPGNNSEFSQPIELRFNELISGVRSDIGIKIFGDDMQVLNDEAAKIAKIVQKISGSTAVKVEQTSGLPLLNIDVNRSLAAQYGLSVREIQNLVASSLGGQQVGEILQGDRRFDFVIRLTDQDQIGRE